MTDKPFLIYRSSAGSGKTFTLAREYLQLALANPTNYASILGVTFTNKATEEMKQRIVRLLKGIIQGEEEDLANFLAESIDLEPAQLKKNASHLITRILHEYGRFSLVTIDSFFQQVIRSFAREMGLQGSFSIDLDTDNIMQKVVDDLLASVGEEKYKELRNWLIQFAATRVEEGKSWDFRNDIKALARETIKESYKPHAERIREINEKDDFNREIIGQLNKIRFSFENHCKKLASSGHKKVEQAGGIDQFKSKIKGPAALFLKFLQGNYEITQNRRKTAEDINAWLKKDQLNSDLVRLLEEEIFPICKELISFFDAKYLEYCSALEVLRYFYTFGILSEINTKLQEYRDQNDVMLIADLPDFLRQIIRDSETPYIYEKVGNRYQHYLIDEFQDTSLFQWQNFKPLVKNATDAVQRSIVVGDVKQSIYRWRGGDLRLLGETVGNDIGTYHTEVRDLATNWRSSVEVVNFNNFLFSGIKEAAESYFRELDPSFRDQLSDLLSVYDEVEQKPQKTDLTGSIRIEYLPDDKEDNWKEEAISKTIQSVEEAQRKGYSLRDITILTRTQREGKRIADAFMNYKTSDEADPTLSYEVVSSEALFLYSSHSVRFMVSLIKWLHSNEDDIVLAEWMYEWQRYICETEKEDATVFDSKNFWKKHVPARFIKEMDVLRKLPVYELVSRIIYLFDLSSNKAEFTYLQGFQDAVLDFSKNERGDIAAFIDWWEKIRKDRAIQISDDNDAIKILTIHKAKGLEFPLVIIPFLNWSLDHNSYPNDHILWCRPPDKAPFNRLPIIPLKYSGKLKNTYWAGQYWEEHISAFIDNVNLLYVAFTRPIRSLIAFAPGQKNNKIDKSGNLIIGRLSSHPKWTEDQKLIIGDLPDNDFPNGRGNKEEFGLENYAARPWKDKISLQMKGSSKLKGNVFEIREKGILLHKLLSQIKLKDEIQKVKEDDLYEEIRALINHPEVDTYFRDVDEVLVEAPVLIPGGDYKRIDRLVRKKDTWFLIDFKTGKPREKDKIQLSEYTVLLHQMGYENVKGRLIYMEPVKVVEV